MPTAYVTAPPDAAEEIARDLVDNRLAACVNRVPCQSTYRWDGEVHEDREELLLAKTTEKRYAELVARVERIHPYDVPCIERFEESAVVTPFREWRDEAVADGTDARDGSDGDGPGGDGHSH